MNEYSSFAQVYDTFMDNVPYDLWAKKLGELLREYGCASAAELGATARAADDLGKVGQIPVVADLGCGTGAMTLRLAGMGYRMIGVDLSEEMLMIAADRSPEADRPVYLHQDMRKLDLGEPVQAMVSVCDCMNYLLTEDDLIMTFRAARRNLQEGGVFLFDFHTLYYYRDVVGDSTIAESREDCAFIWENWFDPGTHLNEYDLTLFMEEEDGRFRRSAETHCQRGYTTEEMCRAAEAGGLQVMQELDGEDFGPVREDSERVLMVLVKKG